ncbi:MAG TPA: Uma2 family endonuclease [Thermoanaerobaculia bacterium]|nr:Uma2 family endonuclease [Thermoanaerobaculia bacterium]
MNVLLREKEIEYPTSDGQPMAESQEHVQAIIELLLGLRQRFAGAPDVWVGANFFLFYEQGNPKACVSPDVLLARGVVKRYRPNYLLWQEKPPSLVVEVTSPKTKRKDLGPKKSLYERIGVEEYILFDPLAEYLRPPLQGFRLMRGIYQPIPLEADGSLRSRTTDLWFKREGDLLRLVDVPTGQRILWSEEQKTARVAAEAKAASAEAKAASAEARAESEAAKAASEAARAESEAAKAAEESAARQAAEERIRALEAELSRLRKG